MPRPLNSALHCLLLGLVTGAPLAAVPRVVSPGTAVLGRVGDPQRPRESLCEMAALSGEEFRAALPELLAKEPSATLDLLLWRAARPTPAHLPQQRRQAREAARQQWLDLLGEAIATSSASRGRVSQRLTWRLMEPQPEEGASRGQVDARRNMRVAALSVVGELGLQDFSVLALAALQDEHEAVQHAARTCLAALYGRQFATVQRWEEFLASARSGIDRSVVEELRDAEEQRRAVRIALVAADGAKAMQALEVGEPDPAVRREAAIQLTDHVINQRLPAMEAFQAIVAALGTELDEPTFHALLGAAVDLTDANPSDEATVEALYPVLAQIQRARRWRLASSTLSMLPRLVGDAGATTPAQLASDLLLLELTGPEWPGRACEPDVERMEVALEAWRRVIEAAPTALNPAQASRVAKHLRTVIDERGPSLWKSTLGRRILAVTAYVFQGVEELAGLLRERELPLGTRIELCQTLGVQLASAQGESAALLLDAALPLINDPESGVRAAVLRALATEGGVAALSARRVEVLDLLLARVMAEPDAELRLEVLALAGRLPSPPHALAFTTADGPFALGEGIPPDALVEPLVGLCGGDPAALLATSLALSRAGGLSAAIAVASELDRDGASSLSAADHAEVADLAVRQLEAGGALEEAFRSRLLEVHLPGADGDPSLAAGRTGRLHLQAELLLLGQPADLEGAERVLRRAVELRGEDPRPAPSLGPVVRDLIRVLLTAEDPSAARAQLLAHGEELRSPSTLLEPGDLRAWASLLAQREEGADPLPSARAALVWQLRLLNHEAWKTLPIEDRLADLEAASRWTFEARDPAALEDLRSLVGEVPPVRAEETYGEATPEGLAQHPWKAALSKLVSHQRLLGVAKRLADPLPIEASAPEVEDIPAEEDSEGNGKGG